MENESIENSFVELREILPIKYSHIYLQYEAGSFSERLQSLIPNLKEYYEKNKSVKGNYFFSINQMFYRTHIIFSLKEKTFYIESINRKSKDAIKFESNCLIKFRGNDKPFDEVEPALAIDFYKVKDNIKVIRKKKMIVIY